MSEHKDLVVVGAGPCGIAVGAAATQGGLDVVLFDKGSITSSLVDYPYYMTFFSTAEKLEIAGVPFTIAEMTAGFSPASTAPAVSLRAALIT